MIHILPTSPHVPLQPFRAVARDVVRPRFEARGHARAPLWTAVLLGLLLVPGCGAETDVTPDRFDEVTDPRPEAWSLLIWNINGGVGAVAASEPEAVLSRLASHPQTGSQLVALAEVRPEWADRLREAVGARGSAPWESLLGSRGGDQRLLALWDPQRFEAESTAERGDLVPDGAGRAPLVLHMRDRLTAVRFVWVVVHLRALDGAARAAELTALRQWREGIRDPVLITGDFNVDCPPSVTGEGCEPAWQTLLAGPPSLLAFPNDADVGSLCETTADAGLLDFALIDARLAQQAPVRSAEILDGETWCAPEMGDGAHRPVRVRF